MSAAAAAAAAAASAASFTFSDEIERELAELEGTAAGGGGTNATLKDSSRGGVTNPASRPSSSATAALGRDRAAAAAANPQAYAELHFSRVNPVGATAAAAAVYRSATHAQTAARHRDMDAAAAAAAAERRVEGERQQQQPPPSGFSSSSSSAASSSPEHRTFYDDDAPYFNLGGSSFPLLPHNSLYEDEQLCSEQMAAAQRNGRGQARTLGPETAFSPSGRVHSQHFSSILNQPASRLQYAAGPALSGASGYLPSLARIWTFTTGIAPPDAVTRASDELSSFAEEAASLDPLTPFVLPPAPPGLNESDMDLAVVARYLQAMKPVMQAYKKNHPQQGFAYAAAAASKAREAEREKAQAAAAAVRTQLAKERARTVAQRSKEKRRRHETISDDEDDSDNEQTNARYAASSSSAAGQFAPSAAVAVAAAAPSSSSPPDDDDAAAVSLSLAKELRDCYSSIPAVYFSAHFQVASLDFLTMRDQRDVQFVQEQAKQLREKAAGVGANSFDVLSSYHNSQHFTLPSLAEQKAAQLQAYKESQDRLASMHDLNEKHLALQVELSAYLDTVEMNLLQQISHKSWIFFDALKNMQQIQGEITTCLARIVELRHNVAALKASLSDAGLGVVRQVRAVANTRLLIQKLELIATVLKTSPTVQLLLSTGDFSAGMQLIHSTKQVLSTELAGLTCMRNVQIKLEEHARLIGQMMQMEFIGVAVRGASFYLHEFKPTDKMGKGSSKTKLKHAVAQSRTLSEEEQERLVPLVSHLLELGQLSAVFDSYRDELQQILKQRLMDLVHELLNQLRDESAAAEESATARKKKQSDKEREEEGEEDEEEEESHLSERDQVAANSLFNDHPTGSADPSPPSTDSSTPAPTLLPSDSGAPPAVSPSAAVAPLPIASPVTAAAATPLRKQAAIAMPVNPQLRAPSHANGHASPSHSATASAITTASSSPASSPTAAPLASTTPVAPLSLASTPIPPTPSASISSRFSSLQHAEFLNLLQPMFTSLMDLLQRASALRHLALTVLSNSPLPAAQKEALTRDLNDALVSLLEFTHGKIGKILQTRAGAHADLELRQLRQYLDVILNFIQEGEKLAGKTCYGLRGTLLVQAKSFLVNFHGKCLASLAAALEREKWTRVDVPPEYQQLIDAHFVIKKADMAPAATKPVETLTAKPAYPFADSTSILDVLASGPSAPSSTTAAAALKSPTWQSKSWNDAEEAGEEEEAGEKKVAASVPPLSTVKADDKSSDIKRVLFVARDGGKGSSGVASFMKFPVVDALLVLLHIIGQYIECSSQLQAVGSDILNRLVELLQVFNSRSCQLVLGAGAMHLSGLKSITASHLALASQSVGLLVTQIPVLRAVLASRLPPKHHVLLVSLDRVAQDCQEHQREIFAKLVAIMDELVRAMRERMETLPWAHTEGAASNGATTTAAAVAALSPDESKVDECVKTVMKQTCSLHRALSDLLLPEQRDLIFRDISHRFLAQITMFVQKRDTSKQSVKSKLAYNINHIITRLRTCTGTDEASLSQLATYVL